MPNKTSKTEIEAYGAAVEKLLFIQGSFSPYLMLHARLSTVLAKREEITQLLGDDAIELIDLLREHFYNLLLIHDRHRKDNHLDDSELNEVRQILKDK